MPNYSKGSVILVRFPFSDLSAAKIRPAIVVSPTHPSQDLLIVPLTSRLDRLQPGEFAMRGWQTAGLNVVSAVKRGIFTIHQNLIIKNVGTVSAEDSEELTRSLRAWLGL